MSSVPISEFIDVGIALAPTPAGLSGFGKLLFLSKEAAAGSNPILTTERIRQYSSMEALAGDFPSGEINKAATVYYAQQPKPKFFMVGLIDGTATAAKATGSSAPNLTSLQAITAGGFSITIDGTLVVISAVNRSSTTSYLQVAAAVEAKLQVQLAGTQCDYDAGLGRFVITSPTTGATSTITVASADVSGLAAGLGLITAALVQGKAEESPTDALTQCEQFDNSFYGIALDSEYEDVTASLDAAVWTEARSKVFFNTTNDSDCLTPAAASTIAGQIKDASLKRTLSVYAPASGTYAGISVAGRAFTVNFEGTNTTITLMYKKLPTIPVAKISSSQKGHLDSINCNVFLDVGGTSFFAESKMADATFFDTVHGTDWLQNRIETDVFNLLYQSTTKVPYTDTGVSMIIQKVEQGLRQGVTNGLIAPGTTTDGTYLDLGYRIDYIPVSDVSTADKGNRIYRGITFIAVGAGAIHRVTITGSFSE